MSVTIGRIAAILVYIPTRLEANVCMSEGADK